MTGGAVRPRGIPPTTALVACAPRLDGGHAQKLHSVKSQGTPVAAQVDRTSWRGERKPAPRLPQVLRTGRFESIAKEAP